jgi:hypothetical protein
MFNFFPFKNQSCIEVFVRHCHYSAASAHKDRFATFSKEKCFQNLLSTVDKKRVNLTFLLDTFFPSAQPHFITQQSEYPVIEIKAGNEANSFLAMLDHVMAKKLKPETVVYFLEDDYIHKEGWVDVLLEGLSLPSIDYVTLFDHRDKYFFPSYADLQAKIFHTKTCHWRTTPSTTNTYAMRFKTLMRDLPIHRVFSEGRKISADHEKFCSLGEKGSVLISSIPGYSTHVEPEFASPCQNWEEVLEQSLSVLKK